jgi:hypothetical protein
MHLRAPRRTLAAVATAAAAGLVVAAAPAQAQGDVVATGLNNPRMLSFSPGGTLYVAEAGTGGSGPCAEGETGLACLGATGSIMRVDLNGDNDTRVITGLPSLGTEEGASGPADIEFTGNSNYAISIGLGGNLEYRAAFGAGGTTLGTIMTGQLGHRAPTVLADVLANEAAANPDGTDVDSNPGGLLKSGDGYFVADAGGNAVVRANHEGTFSTLAVLPPALTAHVDPVPFPPFSLPAGFPADAVPTSVVQGPDGAYYISQLTGVPFEAGLSSIWRVVPGSAPTRWATGLTNVTDLAFAPDGTLYAVEIAANGLFNGPMGALVSVPAGSTSPTVVDGDLFAPYGVAISAGNAYVTTCSVCVGGGEVHRIPLG